MLPWSFFSASLSDATNSITSQRSMLRQFQFPIEIIPLSSVIASFLNYLMGFSIIYIYLGLVNNNLFLLLPFLLLAVLLNFIFVLGLSLIFSITNVFIRDLEHILGFLMMFWFWITPIFYPINLIPLKLLWIYKLNPMSAIVSLYREIILHVNIPPWYIFFEACLWSFLSLFVGLFLFKCLGSSIFKKV
jgi:ABC-2 type transport system permease protein